MRRRPWPFPGRPAAPRAAPRASAAIHRTRELAQLLTWAAWLPPRREGSLPLQGSRPRGRRASRRHLDLDRLPRVVEVAALVPDGFARLDAAARVGRAGEDAHRACRARRQRVRPEPPREAVVVLAEDGRLPGGAVVVGDVDRRNLARAREREAGDDG